MYTIFALTPPQYQIATPEARLRHELSWLIPFIQAISKVSPLFESLGIISSNNQKWIDARIREYGSSDEGTPEDLIAEFDRLSGHDRVSVLHNPQAFFDMTIASTEKMRREGYDGIRINASTTGLAINGSLTRVIFDAPQDRGTLAIEMPMHNKGAPWFSGPLIMRSIFETVLEHVPTPLWVCAYPSMYVGLQKSLFRDRRNFGWMGYSAKTLEDRGPLYAIEPKGGGTLLQLKPTMMTLHPEDMALCNEVEAYLSDHEILPLM